MSSILTKIRELVAGKPATAEEIEEARRIHDDLETQRLSQRSGAGENYQAFGGPGT